MITKALQTLKRVKVKIPYASKLYKFFPADHVIMRTNFNRFLDLIKASAALHQFQRENDGEYIYANGQDYDIARQVLLKTTSNQSMIPLTKNQKKLLEILNELGDNWSSVSDLEPKVTFMSESQLRRELDRLVGYGFLLKDKEHREGSRKPVMVYQRKKFTKISIPTWEGIKDEICN
jgi:predicted transcriptional regulator